MGIYTQITTPKKIIANNPATRNGALTQNRNNQKIPLLKFPVLEKTIIRTCVS